MLTTKMLMLRQFHRSSLPSLSLFKLFKVNTRTLQTSPEFIETKNINNDISRQLDINDFKNISIYFQLPSDNFYEIIKQRCFEIIKLAIEQRNNETKIIIKEVLHPHKVCDVGRMNEIYTELKEYFKNNCGVLIEFYGYNSGSIVHLNYKDENI